MTTATGSDHPGVELDLGAVRSRITDLHSQSIELATDLLAVLGPLPMHITSTSADRDGDVHRGREVEVVELTRACAEPTAQLLEIGHSPDAHGLMPDLVRPPYSGAPDHRRTGRDSSLSPG